LKFLIATVDLETASVVQDGWGAKPFLGVFDHYFISIEIYRKI